MEDKEMERHQKLVALGTQLEASFVKQHDVNKTKFRKALKDLTASISDGAKVDTLDLCGADILRLHQIVAFIGKNAHNFDFEIFNHANHLCDDQGCSKLDKHNHEVAVSNAIFGSRQEERIKDVIESHLSHLHGNEKRFADDPALHLHGIEELSNIPDYQI